MVNPARVPNLSFLASCCAAGETRQITFEFGGLNCNLVLSSFPLGDKTGCDNKWPATIDRKFLTLRQILNFRLKSLDIDSRVKEI